MRGLRTHGRAWRRRVRTGPTMLSYPVRFSVATAALLVFVTPAIGAVRNVPADFPAIQQALNASVSGDVVLVAPGTHMENLDLATQQSGVALLSTGGAQ